MGFIRELFQKQEKQNTGERDELYVFAPVGGQVKPLDSLNDGVFSERLLGNGCVIVPDVGMLVAPFDGNIVMEVDTGHAVGIISDDGIELLIHIGIDTVTMNGEGFAPSVSQGERVTKGQELLTFSREKINRAGFIDDVILIVSNTKDYRGVAITKSGEVKAKEVLIAIKK